MKEQLVSLEVARLLKEKGFDIPCRFCYGAVSDSLWNLLEERRGTWCETDIEFDWNDCKVSMIDNSISAPTQSLAQKWLREEKNIIVIADYNCVGYAVWNYEIFTDKHYFIMSEKAFDTYEKALEAGLIETLKLI